MSILQASIGTSSGTSSMRPMSKILSRLSLLIAAFVFFTAAPTNLGPLDVSGLFGIDQAHAQRTNRRDQRSQASGQGIVSQRVADAYNEALELTQAEQHDAALNLVRPLLDNASPFERSIIFRFMGQTEIDRDRFDRAAGYFQQAIDSGGLEGNDLAALYLVVGQIYMVDEQYDRAITTLQLYFTVAEEPEAQAYYILAQVYAVASRIREAIAPASTAVAMTRAEPRENFVRLLMSLHLTLDEWDNALPLLQQLVTLVPSKDEYWVQLAGVYAQVGRDREAFAVYQFRHLMGFLDTSRELVILADLYMFHEVPIKAAQLLQASLDSERVERTGANWEKLGNAYFTAREFSDARGALTRAANLAPDGQIYYRIAGTYIQEENWSQALRFLQRALNRGGLDDTGQAWILLGHAQNALDNLDEAEDAFRTASGYSSFRDDALIWIQHIEARRAAAAAEAAQQVAYREDATSIRSRGQESVVLAETAYGLAQEAFETARLATRVTAAERQSLIDSASATLEEAREVDNEARNPDFGTAANIRAAVRDIGVAAREDGFNEFAEELEADSETFLLRRTNALTSSDQLIREADDMLHEARQM